MIEDNVYYHAIHSSENMIIDQYYSITVYVLVTFVSEAMFVAVLAALTSCDSSIGTAQFQK